MTVGRKQLANGIGNTLVLFWASVERLFATMRGLHRLRTPNRYAMSAQLSVLGLGLSAFAEHPFADIGRALD